MSTRQDSQPNAQSGIIQGERFFVISGGPGGGKSTLINKLRERGIMCVDETGRAIIQTQMKIDGRGLPWIDSQLLGEVALQQDVANYLAADPAMLTVFDRGIVDHIGGAELNGWPVAGHVRTAVERFRYNQTVFIAPPWPEIYTTDSERRQDFAEAVRTHDAMVLVYRAEGYSIVTLPLAGLEERADFVLERIAAVVPTVRRTVAPRS